MFNNNDLLQFYLTQYNPKLFQYCRKIIKMYYLKKISILIQNH